DHATNRLFYYDYQNGTVMSERICGSNQGATIFHSDDDGETWSHGFDMDLNCSENPTVLVGKPRISTTTGYPSVVYLCGNNFGSGVAGTGSTGKTCSKSLDGGFTWTGQLFTNQLPGGGQGCYAGQCKDALHPYPECATGSTLIDSAQNPTSAGNDVQPMPDGTLLVPVSCRGNTYLSQSKDEGKTWTIKNRIPETGILRVDSVGNLYKFSGTLVSASRDGGLTWTPQYDMLAPGVSSPGSIHQALGMTLVGHEVGRVAINYYGVRAGNAPRSDGFITETRDIFAANPVFWSGFVNRSDDPLLFGTSTQFDVGNA